METLGRVASAPRSAGFRLLGSGFVFYDQGSEIRVEGLGLRGPESLAEGFGVDVSLCI